MSLANYPPGVTGREPEISGEDRCVYCDQVFDLAELNEDGACEGCIREEEIEERSIQGVHPFYREL